MDNAFQVAEYNHTQKRLRYLEYSQQVLLIGLL